MRSQLRCILLLATSRKLAYGSGGESMRQNRLFATQTREMRTFMLSTGYMTACSVIPA